MVCLLGISNKGTDVKQPQIKSFMSFVIFFSNTTNCLHFSMRSQFTFSGPEQSGAGRRARRPGPGTCECGDTELFRIPENQTLKLEAEGQGLSVQL